MEGNYIFLFETVAKQELYITYIEFTRDQVTPEKPSDVVNNNMQVSILRRALFWMRLLFPQSRSEHHDTSYKQPDACHRNSWQMECLFLCSHRMVLVDIVGPIHTNERVHSYVQIRLSFQ